MGKIPSDEELQVDNHKDVISFISISLWSSSKVSPKVMEFRISRAKRCWAPAGIRPHAPAQVVREYMYAYAAVAPTQGQMISLVLPEASNAMINLFLEQVGQTFSTSFIIMQVDQAGWHSARERS